MLRTLLYLNAGEFGRLWPFFGFYLLLFVALTIADGLSLALFVQRVGAANLPGYYAITGGANLVLIGWYILSAERAGGRRVFELIIGGTMLAYLVSWGAIEWFQGGDAWYGLVFVARELAYTLVIMHFGTYLQDFFTRQEMNRVLPIVYSGGRVGGILGGLVLQRLSAPLGLVNLMLAVVGLGLLCLLALWAISTRIAHVHSPEDERGDTGVVAPRAGEAAGLETRARTSLVSFLQFVWASPLLFWTTVSNTLYIVCRWILNYQYNTFFEGHFPDDVAMARFLGMYTQAALALSLVLQLFVVSRLIAWIGLKGGHAVYATLLLAGLGTNVFLMTFPLAVYSRFLEAELRFGLRNPIAQLMTNKFSKALRIRVRAWSLGVLIPIATLATSALLSGLTRTGLAGWISWAGGAAGLAYFLSSFGLYASFTERREPQRTFPEEPAGSPTSRL